MHSSTYVQELWFCFECSFVKIVVRSHTVVQCNNFAGLCTSVVIKYCENFLAVSSTNDCNMVCTSLFKFVCSVCTYMYFGTYTYLGTYAGQCIHA